MRTECQIIKTSNSFITVLLIYHKLPAIAQSLSPRSLKNRPPTAPLSVPGILKLCCPTSSLPQRPQTWTLIQIQPFFLLFLLQWMNLQKYCSLKNHHSDLAAQTRQTFCLVYRVWREFIVHIPPQKGKYFQTTTLIWVYFPQTTLQFLTMKTLP